jgi:hypothetical protein
MSMSGSAYLLSDAVYTTTSHRASEEIYGWDEEDG